MTTKTPAEEITECRAEIVRAVAAFRTEYAGRILRTRIEDRSVWMDGGEYYSALTAEVWTGAEVTTHTVCADGAAAWHNAGGCDLMRGLDADATEETLVAVTAWRKVEADYADRLHAARSRRDGSSVRAGDMVIVARGLKVPQGMVAVVSWCGDSAYGRRVRLSPLDERGMAVVKGRDGGGDTYTAACNVVTLMPTEDARPDWRAPVTETCARRWEVASLAWTWAHRDALAATESDLGARSAYDAVDLRSLHEVELWARYADLLTSGDVLAVEIARAFETCAPMLDATTPRSLESLLDCVASDRHTVENAMSIAEGDRAEYLRGVVLTTLPVVYVAPIKTRAKRARKAASVAA